MESDLRDLYQQVILDHHRRPRNHRAVPGASLSAEGYNPLCGDRVKVELVLGKDGRYSDVAFTGTGCAICTASASMMTEAVKGKTRDEAETMFHGFQELVKGEREPGDLEGSLGKLMVFAGVREFPVRVKCATLPWHTLHAAAEGKGTSVTTE